LPNFPNSSIKSTKSSVYKTAANVDFIGVF